MPPWVNDLIRLALSSFGLAIVWKLSWAVRGWVESQKIRAENEGKMLSALNRLGNLIESGLGEQRKTNEQMWAAVQVHSMRLNKLEDTDGGRG